MSGTVLSTEDIAVNKSGINPCPYRIYSLVGEDNKYKYMNKIRNMDFWFLFQHVKSLGGVSLLCTRKKLNKLSSNSCYILQRTEVIKQMLFPDSEKQTGRYKESGAQEQKTPWEPRHS